MGSYLFFIKKIYTINSVIFFKKSSLLWMIAMNNWRTSSSLGGGQTKDFNSVSMFLEIIILNFLTS